MRLDLRVSGRTARANWFAALLLALAFALAGWKILSRPPASNFAPPRLAALVRPPNEAARSPSLGQVQRQISAGEGLGFDAGFVSSAPGQAVHAPSVVELSDGRLRAVWFSGTREGAGDVVIKTSVMDPSSLRWGAESTLFDRQRIQRGLWRYVKKLGNPVIARAPDGSLLLWLVTVSVGGWAGSSITWARSTDEGEHWGDPRRLVTSPFLNISTLVKGAPFFYANGQVGLPVYHELASKFAEILRIDGNGQILDKTRIPGSHASLQPVVLPINAEQAQVYLRSAVGTAVMASSTRDAGKTWDPVRATGWPNPDSALAGVVTGTAGQWLALNPDHAGRQILALLHGPTGGSFEGARPWVVEPSAAPRSRVPIRDFEALLAAELDARGAGAAQVRGDVASAVRQLCGADTCAPEFSYPYLLQGRDGHLHLVYTWHRARIKHVRLDPVQAALTDAAPTPR